MSLFQPAVKTEAKLRMALSGPSGSGKTFTSLVFATKLASLGSGKIALVDTESGSASKYADMFTFDVAEMTHFHPQNYVKAINAAEDAGYDVVILDSITHAWTGKGGILDIVGGNFNKWKDVNPIEQAFLNAIIGSELHVIATMRAKTQYEVEKDSRGKAVPKKVGMGAIQRDGIEYEFDITAMLDIENNITIEKTRCPALKGVRENCPDGSFLVPVIEWLGSSGSKPDPEPQTQRNNRQADTDNDAQPPDEEPPMEHVNGTQPEQPKPQTVADDDNLRKKLHAVGNQCYGGMVEGGWEAKRAELCKSDKLAGTSSNDWTVEQANMVISRMQSMITDAAMEVKTIAEAHDVDGASIEYYAEQVGANLDKIDAKGYAILPRLSRAQLEALAEAVLADADNPLEDEPQKQAA